MKEKLLIVLPTFNEAENIRTVLEEILKIDSSIDILVIDDNSPDNTSYLVETISKENPRINLIKRKEKLGLASAYKEDFRFGLSNGYAYIMQMDADLSHNPEEIPNFLKFIKYYDVVIGSRYIDGIRIINWSIQRLLLSYLAGVYTRLITGLRLYDVTSGFKYFRREVLEKINLASLHSESYGFNIELNYLCQKKKFQIIEIPIIFSERAKGKSKLSGWIIFKAATLVCRLPFRKY